MTTVRNAVIATIALAAATATNPVIRPAHACDECQLKKTGLFIGQFALMGNGTARSWVKLDKAGKPSSVGVTFSETALSGLAKTAPKGMMSVEHVLALPKEAASTGLSHISLDWTPAGHPPAGIYNVPHFDIHFYLDNQAALNKITATGKDIAISDKKPEAKFMPAGYIMPPGTQVSRMGSHAVDASSPELKGQPFKHTFIYGYYNGRMNFFEPMIAKSFLDTKTNVSAPVKVPAAYPKRGYFPTAYSIKFDSVRKEYTVSLDNLKLRG